LAWRETRAKREPGLGETGAGKAKREPGLGEMGAGKAKREPGLGEMEAGKAKPELDCPRSEPSPLEQCWRERVKL